MEKKLEKLIAKILGLKLDQVNNETGPDNTVEWDSFNGLVLAAELEREFKIKFTTSEVVSIKKVADIKKILHKHEIKNL